MAASIGIRIYRFEIRERGMTDRLPFSSTMLSKHPRAFIEHFSTKYSTSTKDDEKERSWYFSNIVSDNDHVRGYINYGTFGFESRLVDTVTNKTKYQRKTTDVEEVPLFFDFWAPRHSRFGLVAFQSFQGRSCITLVTEKFREVFENENRNCLVIFRKLMPSNSEGGVFSKASVKRVRLISKKLPADAADAYLNTAPGELIDLEVSFSARRKKTLGSLSALMGKMPADTSGLIEFRGMEFDEAIAEIQIGKSLRRVGIFGPSGDAGVIDITENISKGVDGHPTLASIQKETTQLLAAFYKMLGESTR